MKKTVAMLCSAVLLALPLYVGFAEEEHQPPVETPEQVETAEPAVETEPPAETETPVEPVPSEMPEIEDNAEGIATETPSETPAPAYTLVFVFDEDAAVEMGGNETVLCLMVGERLPLQYQATPGDMDLLWESEDESIAAIDEAGEVEAISEGSTWVKAILPDGSSTGLQVRVLQPDREATASPAPTEPAFLDELQMQKKERDENEPLATAEVPAFFESEFFAFPAATLPAPTNLLWAGNYVATWDRMAACDGYYVCLYKNGEPISETASIGSYSTRDPRLNVKFALHITEEGSYYFIIKGINGVGAYINGSEACEVTEMAYSPVIQYIKPTSKLQPPTNLRIGGVQLTQYGEEYFTLYFDMPSDAVAGDAYGVNFYGFNEDTFCWEWYMTTHPNPPGTASVEYGIYVDNLRLYAAKRFRFTVTGYSSRLDSVINSDESETSPVFYLEKTEAHRALEAFLSRLYQNVLGRVPDTSWESWIDGLTNGVETGASAVRGFFLSTEFEAQGASDSDFVTLVYQACMNRQPNADEVTYWTNYLDQGIGRAAVLNEFVKSQEYGLICESYGITRGEMPVDAADRNISVTQFVQRLYTIILNRQAERSGVEYWTNYLLNQGGDGKTTAYEFAFSQEFMNAGLSDDEFITRMYRALLNREPEAEGMQAWRDEIALNGREGIFDGFADSAEFGLVMASYGVK